jgi:hypothetical protein
MRLECAESTSVVLRICTCNKLTSRPMRYAIQRRVSVISVYSAEAGLQSHSPTAVQCSVKYKQSHRELCSAVQILQAALYSTYIRPVTYN